MTPDGLFVETEGPEGAPPLVLVHGFGASNHSWRKWVPELAVDHRLHLVELAGFGRAPNPADGDYAPHAQGRRVAELVSSIGGAHPPVLVGHSLGGAVILIAALRLLDAARAAGTADPLRGIVVVSGAVFPLDFPRYMALARRPLLGDLLLAGPPPRWAIQMGLRGIVGDPATVDAEQVEGYRAPLGDPERRRAILRAARQLRPDADAAGLVPHYGRLSVPLLALWGDRDPVIPPSFAGRLAAAVPRGRAVLLPGVGHLVPEEAPRPSLAALRSFLSETDPRHRQDPTPGGAGSAPSGGSTPSASPP
jgi:pimeloyl-ACP methyl ester carboxylesterase